MDKQTEEDCGVMFVAVGPHYKFEALTAAQRVTEVMPGLKVLIYADWDPEEAIDGVEFKRVERATRSFLDKVVLLEETPFERTLFLDTDIWLVDPIWDVLELLDKFDIVGGYDSARVHDVVEGIPEAFPEINTGLVAYRKTDAVLRFFKNVAETYEPIQNEVAGDQTAFRMCLYEADLRVHVLPPEYNCQIRTAGYVKGRVKVIHARNISLEKVAQRINRFTGRRVFVASPWRGISVLRYSERKMKIWSAFSIVFQRVVGLRNKEKLRMPLRTKK